MTDYVELTRDQIRYRSNGEHIRKRVADRYYDDRNKIGEIRSQKVYCEICDKELTRATITRHKKSQKHLANEQRYLSALPKTETERLFRAFESRSTDNIYEECLNTITRLQGRNRTNVHLTDNERVSMLINRINFYKNYYNKRIVRYYDTDQLSHKWFMKWYGFNKIMTAILERVIEKK